MDVTAPICRAFRNEDALRPTHTTVVASCRLRNASPIEAPMRPTPTIVTVSQRCISGGIPVIAEILADAECLALGVGIGAIGLRH